MQHLCRGTVLLIYMLFSTALLPAKAQVPSALYGTWDFLLSRGGQLGNRYVQYPTQKEQLSLVFRSDQTKQVYRKDSLLYTRMFSLTDAKWLDYDCSTEKESFRFQGADTLILTPKGADQMSDWYVRRKPQAKKP